VSKAVVADVRNSEEEKNLSVSLTESVVLKVLEVSARHSVVVSEITIFMLWWTKKTKSRVYYDTTSSCLRFS
jgi:hypothetical protein